MKSKGLFPIKSQVIMLLMVWVIIPLLTASQLPVSSATGNAPQVPTDSKVVLTIPAAAFKSFQDAYDYENHGRCLVHKHTYGELENGWYYAPVQLPHAATITKFTFYWYDISKTLKATAILQRAPNNNDTWDNLVTADSFGFAGYGSTSVSNLNIYIENDNYRYWIVWDLPAAEAVYGCSVVIEYIPPNWGTGSILALPAPAFTPIEEEYPFRNEGRDIICMEDDHTNCYFVAPVVLPQGAVINYIGFFWYDANIGANARAVFQRSRFGYGFDDMAEVESADIPGGFGYGYDTTVDNPTIDNTMYSYWMVWEIPGFVSVVNTKPLYSMINYTPSTISSTSITIAAAGFYPHKDGYNFQHHGRFLIHLPGLGGVLNNGSYYTPVQLPQGATVRSVTFHYYNTKPTSDIVAGLYFQRTKLNVNNYQNLVVITPRGPTTGYIGVTDDIISFAKIDNTQYAYWVAWDHTVSQEGEFQKTYGCAVTTNYTEEVHIFLPIIRRN